MRPTWASLGQTVAVSVATILGTGILGLPTALYGSGVRPFLFLFVFNLIAQLGVVCATSELMQRTLHRSKPAISSSPSSPSSHTNGTTSCEQDDSTDEHSPIATDLNNQILDDDIDSFPPSLHSLAENFISTPSLRVVFNLLVMGHFIFIIVAYALAAPQAYAAIFPFLSAVPVYVRTTVFLFGLSVVVYFLTAWLLPTLSVATLVKGVLLVLLVALTLTRGLVIRQPITVNWSLPNLVDPLLMGTIALAGIVNLMPVTFQTCLQSLRHRAAMMPRQNRVTSIKQLADGSFLRAYRNASYLAIILCFVINIAWVYAVLLVVPQTTTDPAATSLQSAAAAGQISTIPLMEVLQASHDKFNGIVAVLVNLFIAISVTISFLVMSVGMLHFITGSVSKNHRTATTSSTSSLSTSSWSKRFFDSLFLRYWVGGVGIVYVIALSNPAGLLHIMEGVTTLALNLEAGVFIVYMFYVARTSPTLHYNREGRDGDQATAMAAFDAGYLSRRHAAFIVTYLVMYFTIAVLVDLLIYMPSLMFS